MDSDAKARAVLDAIGLEGVPAVSDPDRCLYRQFGIPRARLLDLLSARVWWRALTAARRHGAALAAGDKRQSHGAVVLRGGKVVARALYGSMADRQDWRVLARRGARVSP